MRLKNFTTHRISRTWLQKMLDHLGVNPQIEIHYKDNPKSNTKPNFFIKINRKYSKLDGFADDKNRVYLYVGRWEGNIFEDYTPKYVKWLLLHELRHQYYYYHKGNDGDKWKRLSEEERDKREERACNRFANLIMGVPSRDFEIFRKDVKTKCKYT